jgi:hypothetical protein
MSAEGEEEGTKPGVVIHHTPDSPDRPSKHADDEAAAVEDSRLVPSQADASESEKGELSVDSQRAGQVAAGNGGDGGGGGGEGGNVTRQVSSNNNRRPGAHSRHPDGGYGWVIVFAAFLQQVRAVAL